MKIAMLALRYAPVPQLLKQRAIWLAQPKAVLASAAVITDSHGRVLLLRARYSGSWILPGGALNAGEDPVAGLRRECMEELGSPVNVERLSGIYCTRGRSLLGTHGARALLVFRCAPLASMPRLSDEHDAFEFACVDDLAPRQRTLVRDALQERHGIRMVAGS